VAVRRVGPDGRVRSQLRVHRAGPHRAGHRARPGHPGPADGARGRRPRPRAAGRGDLGAGDHRRHRGLGPPRKAQERRRRRPRGRDKVAAVYELRIGWRYVYSGGFNRTMLMCAIASLGLIALGAYFATTSAGSSSPGVILIIAGMLAVAIFSLL